MSSRETEVYKDKIEVSLDGRQVFYLFFGGAVIACMVFVLGVMVGKRVEARAHLDRAGTSAERDPLAALDRLDADGPRGLSFRQALTSGAAPASDVDRTIAALDRTRAAAALGKPAAVEPAKVEAPAKVEPARVEAATPTPTPMPAPAKVEPVKAPADKPVAKPAADKPASKPADEPAAKPKGRFTLQLSAFQDKGEAQAFLGGVEKAGFDAYLTEAAVEGKGTFYRVRLGSYGTYEDAVAAKESFEQKVKKIAYVTRL
ncbi:MAG: SPOR domain-containing protein [Kofleriaceae bacterium]